MRMKSQLLGLSLSFAVSTGSCAFAQGQAEVVVRQGDTIEWVATGGIPHKVRFGEDTATSVVEINTILENFDPPLTAGPEGVGDSGQSGNGKLLKAKVKDDAAVGKTFVFTCGVHHRAMLSLPFRVEAKVAGEGPRTHRISGVPGPDWTLQIDTTPPTSP